MPPIQRHANAGSKDQKCAIKIADANNFEIQAGQLAQQKAQSDEIKQFAKMMVDDHTQAQQQLQQIAQQKGWQFSQQLMPVHRAMLEELNKLDGQEFEKAYLYGQVAGHTKVALGLRDAKTELQDAELRQYAATIFPKVQQHLQHAQRLANADEAITAGARISGERGSAEDPARTGASPGTVTPSRPGATDRPRPSPGLGNEVDNAAPRDPAGQSNGK
jgi:putative membrane protein